MKNNKYKLLLSGGGTGGSVSALLAIYDVLKNEKNFEFIWIGTKNGIEKKMIADEGLLYIAIASGKLRRYFSWQNFSDIFLIIWAFFQSLFILSKQKPNLFISAGGFVSVPMAWAAWFLRIPILIHQQDVRAGLANKLMAHFAKIITVTFESSLKDYGKKAIWTGNPTRAQFSNLNIDKTSAKKYFNINSEKPVIFIVGGGTGATSLNELVYAGLEKLSEQFEIIHVSGKGKGREINNDAYHAYEFLDANGMANAYAVTDLIISRCGLSILTEIAAVKKPSILVPMSDSHQEDNAQIFADKEAALVLHEKKINPEIFTEEIFKLFSNENQKEKLKNNLGKIIKAEAAKSVAEIILKNRR